MSVKLENKYVHLQKCKKDTTRHAEKNEHVHSFENDARLTRVRRACDAREKRLVWHQHYSKCPFLSWT